DDREGRHRRREERDPVAREHARRVEGVAPTLPARQPATSVEVELVSEHHDGLQRCGCEEPRVHDGPTFCITAPDSVSPGPNARLTTSVPGDTASSRASSIQM